MFLDEDITWIELTLRNMFGAPGSRVILELVFWMQVALSEGIVIAMVYGD
jgi:hypothetical protein